MVEEERQEAQKREGGSPEADLEQELRELGRRLTRAVEAAWESEETRKLRQEMKAGLERLLAELERGVEKAREHPTTRKVQQEVEEVLESARRGEVVREVKAGLAAALHDLNEELERLAQRLEETGKASGEDEEGGPTA